MTVREVKPTDVRAFTVTDRQAGTQHTVTVVTLRERRIVTCTCGAPKQQGRTTPDCAHAREVEALLAAEHENGATARREQVEAMCYRYFGAQRRDDRARQELDLWVQADPTLKPVLREWLDADERPVAA